MRGAALLGFAALASLSACDLDSLLEVEVPGQVLEEDLDSPALAPTLVLSVVADVECAWDNYVAAAAHHSDEWVAASGNGGMLAWGLRGQNPAFLSTSRSCADNYGLHTVLHGARVQAEANAARIESFDPSDLSEDKATMLATIAAYAPWPFVAFSEGFCGTPLDGGSQVYTPLELADMAESRFTHAIELAREVGSTELELLSLVGRARVRLTLGMYPEVLADVAGVPEDFRFAVTRDPGPTDRQNAHYRSINGIDGSRHATVAPNFRALEWKGVPDPRLQIRDSGRPSHDPSIRHFGHTKTPALSSPTLLASGTEARLFLAEAQARMGRLAEAIDVLNGFHAQADLPEVTAEDLPDQDAVLHHVIEERRRVLFSEGGHRLRDLLAWRGTLHEIPFLGEPGSIHPDGVTVNPDTGAQGQAYQAVTCFPVPASESGAGG